jgi:hypothetical protein
MEAARSSQTPVNFYQATTYHIPKDSNSHTHSFENLKNNNKELEDKNSEVNVNVIFESLLISTSVSSIFR